MVQGERPWEEERDTTEQLAELIYLLFCTFIGSLFHHHGVSSCGALSSLLWTCIAPLT